MLVAQVEPDGVDVGAAYVLEVAVDGVLSYVFDGRKPTFAVLEQGAVVFVWLVKVSIPLYEGVVVVLPIKDNQDYFFKADAPERLGTFGNSQRVKGWQSSPS